MVAPERPCGTCGDHVLEKAEMGVPAAGHAQHRRASAEASVGQDESGLLPFLAQLVRDFAVGTFLFFLEPAVDEQAWGVDAEDAAFHLEALIFSIGFRSLLAFACKLGISEYQPYASARPQLHLPLGEPGAAKLGVGKIVPHPLYPGGQQPLEADRAGL